MGELKAVFFDVNGTLFDHRGCARHVMDLVLPIFADQLPTDDVNEIVRRFNALLLDQVTGRYLRRRESLSRLKRFQALLDSYGVKKPNLAREMSNRYSATRRLMVHQFLHPEAVFVLEELRRRGLRCGVIMNGTLALQRTLLAALGLQSHLDQVVLADAEGYAKPDPRLFNRALELAGVSAGQMLYVGDSPVMDILGASRVGMPTVWFNVRGASMPKGLPAPDFTISSLRELLPIAEL
jgi:HAD superfamily hydrolase (TIGR01549 family)